MNNIRDIVQNLLEDKMEPTPDRYNRLAHLAYAEWAMLMPIMYGVVGMIEREVLRDA